MLKVLKEVEDVPCEADTLVLGEGKIHPDGCESTEHLQANNEGPQ